MRSDTLLLRIAAEQAEIRLPLAALRRLETTQGRKSRWARGAGIGLLTGAVAGGVIGGAVGASSDPDFAGLHAVAGIALGATTGFAVGAIAGSFLTTDRWVEIPISDIMGIDPALAQSPQTRQGFWFNIGWAYGSLGCDNCDGRTGGRGGGLSLGKTLSPKVLLGVGTTNLRETKDGVILEAGTVDLRLRFYPSATGGFFLTGGLGVGVISGSLTSARRGREIGLGAVFGLGYDIRVGRNVSLTPFCNGYAVRRSNANANVGHVGLGLTVH